MFVKAYVTIVLHNYSFRFKKKKKKKEVIGHLNVFARKVTLIFPCDSLHFFQSDFYNKFQSQSQT